MKAYGGGDHLYALVPLSPGEPPVQIEQEARWVPEPASMTWRRENFLPLQGFELGSLGQARSQSLYRLSYPRSHKNKNNNTETKERERDNEARNGWRNKTCHWTGGKLQQPPVLRKPQWDTNLSWRRRGNESRRGTHRNSAPSPRSDG
jgi:hypothetical protein